MDGAALHRVLYIVKRQTHKARKQENLRAQHNINISVVVQISFQVKCVII